MAGSTRLLPIRIIRRHGRRCGLSNPTHFPRSGSKRPLRILAVTNYYETGSWLSIYLEELGHTVSIAATMAEGTAFLAHAGHDVLIADTRLPDGDGWQLLSNRPRSSPLYAIALSGSDWKGERTNSQAAGFHRHLVRPLRLDEVGAALQEAALEIEMAEQAMTHAA